MIQSNSSYKSFWPTAIAVIAGFLAVTLIVFGASLWYGFSMMDDSYLIVTNLFVRGPTWENLRFVFTHFDPELYIPVTFVSYQFNYLFSGLSPGFYHTTNLFIHALNASLVCWIGTKLTGKRAVGLLAAMLFAVHPINTEAVVWVSGRKDLLAAFFALLTTVGYVEYRQSDNRWWYALAAGAFVLALMSKASVVTLPVALIILDIAWSKRPQNRRLILQALPFIGLSTIFACIATFGKTRVIGSSTLLETMLMAGKSTLFYLTKLIIPTGLTPLYPYSHPITASSPDFWVPWLILAVIGILVIASIKKNLWILTAALSFLILLAPSFLNFHKGEVTFFAVDRYVYLPAIALFILVSAGVVQVFDRMRRERRGVASGTAAFLAMIIAVLGGLSYKQTKTWADDEMMFSRALMLYPDSLPARTSLAAIYRDTGRTAMESSLLAEGLSRQPAVAYYTGLGAIEARQGRLAQAEALYLKGAALDPNNPEPLFFLSSLEEQRGLVVKAEQDYRKAIDLDPSYVGAMNNLGGMLQEQGKLEEAEQWFRQALSWNPSFMEGHYNLFQVIEMRHGNLDEALDHLAKAYSLNPGNTDIVVGYAFRLTQRGQKDQAMTILENYLAVHPEDHAAARLLDQIKPAAPPEAASPQQTASQRREGRLKQRLP